MGDKHKRSRWLWIAFAALVLYVGTYFALVKARPEYYTLWDIDGLRASKGIPEYRVGGETSKYVFQPIHAIDRKLRPDYWDFTKEEMNRDAGIPFPIVAPPVMPPNHWYADIAAE